MYTQKERYLVIGIGSSKVVWRICHFAGTVIKIPFHLLMQLKEYTDDTQDLINIKLVRHDLCIKILCSIFPHSYEFLNIYTNVLMYINREMFRTSSYNFSCFLLPRSLWLQYLLLSRQYLE